MEQRKKTANRKAICCEVISTVQVTDAIILNFSDRKDGCRCEK